jgi:hypothetical protein
MSVNGVSLSLIAYLRPVLNPTDDGRMSHICVAMEVPSQPNFHEKPYITYRPMGEASMYMYI